jgi:hypothetical protein
MRLVLAQVLSHASGTSRVLLMHLVLAQVLLMHLVLAQVLLMHLIPAPSRQYAVKMNFTLALYVPNLMY